MGNVDDRFIEDLNLAVADLEQRQSVYGTPRPYYFVLGAPRSGTTLLTQVLAYTYQLGYITNIAARFYLAPVVGCRLSDHILNKPHDRIRFWSRYARTEWPGDVNEFGWFWMNCLNMRDDSDVHGLMSTESYNNTQRRLLSLSHYFKKTIVMKGIYPAYFKPMIDQMLEHKAVWINIERNALDCCESIYRAYQARDVEWFGWYPPKLIYDEMKKLSLLEDRIAAQVVYFQWFYRKIATHTIRYDELCRDPQKALEMLGPFEKILPPDALYYSEYSEEDVEKWEGPYDRAQADLVNAPA